MQLSRRVLLGIVAASLCTVQCLSPTLPLPPPSRPEKVEELGQGQYRATGSIPESGTVFVLNPRTKLVSGELTDRRYSVVFGARAGDSLILWYETSTEASDYVRFDIDGEVIDLRDAGDAGPVDAGAD